MEKFHVSSCEFLCNLHSIPVDLNLAFARAHIEMSRQTQGLPLLLTQIQNCDEVQNIKGIGNTL